MKKLLSLAEVKSIYGDAVFETETAFGVNVFGKYKPNVTFIVPKEFNLGRDGKPVDPMDYVSDLEITDNMNIGWCGNATILFGDFWHSCKGGACFRPTNPMRAQHLLVCVSWGGCFNPTRGNSKEYAEQIGALYFRSASSNGLGTGNDYWVLPVGFTKISRSEEIDGNTSASDILFVERAKAYRVERTKAYREKHANLMAEAAKANDLFLRDKAADEVKSSQQRGEFLSRMEAVKTKVDALCGRGVHMEEVTIGDVYFKHSYTSYLYTEENVSKFESFATSWQQQVEKLEAKEKADAEAKAEFEPKYLELEKRFTGIGWRMETTSSAEVKVFEPYERSYGWNTYHEELKHEFPFSKEGISNCIAMLESKETEIREKREAEEAAERLKKTEEDAKALGLPINVQVWHRSGATNAGQGYVIMPNGMDRSRDGITGDSRRIQRYDEGYETWNQIMPGEVVLRWAHAFTAAEHSFEVIYCPETLTEAQKERIAEIQNELEDEFLGKVGLTGNRSCPSIGNGWNLK